MTKKLGIALGGGGAWSIPGLGVLKALDENDIKVDYLAGCSMGALIMAAYASRFAGEDTLKEVERMVREMKLRQAINFSRHQTHGLFSPRKIGEQFEKNIGKLNFEDLKIPLAIVATDFKTGEEVVFNSGPLTPAIMASCSFTLIFTPYMSIREGF